MFGFKNIKEKIKVKEPEVLWLKLMFFFARSCHQRPERSFSYKEYQFPICARCTGIYLGYIIGITATLISIFVSYNPSIQLFAILILPTTIDGSIQSIFKKESNNKRRFITGIMAGTGLCWMITDLFIYVINL